MPDGLEVGVRGVLFGRFAGRGSVAVGVVTVVHVCLFDGGHGGLLYSYLPPSRREGAAERIGMEGFQGFDGGSVCLPAWPGLAITRFPGDAAVVEFVESVSSLVRSDLRYICCGCLLLSVRDGIQSGCLCDVDADVQQPRQVLRTRAVPVASVLEAKVQSSSSVVTRISKFADPQTSFDLNMTVRGENLRRWH